MRDWPENKMMLAMIRHGETQANKEHRYLGKTDEPLSQSGIEALLSYQRMNMYPEVDYLFTSPMKRCIETAGILYPKLSPTVIPEWEEMDFGQFEYKNYDELKQDARYQAWIDSGGTLDFPEGEGREKFILRCKEGFVRMCSGLRRAAGQELSCSLRAGMIVHGGTIMALLNVYGGRPYFGCQVPNGKGFLCRIENRRREDVSEEGNLRMEMITRI